MLPSGDVTASGSDPKFKLGAIIDRPNTIEVMRTVTILVRTRRTSLRFTHGLLFSNCS